jgi:multidrug efflux pump subunit AcrA (membrane-fusion protein)
MKNTIKYLVILSLFMASCGNKKKEEEQKKLDAKNQVITEVVGVGRIEPEAEIIQLSTENGGIIYKILKQENDSVKAGETIAVLDNAIENAELNQAKSKLQTLTKQLNIDQANINEAKSKLANAQTNANRLRNLFNQGAETKQVLDNAETETKNLTANLERQQSQMQYSKSQVNEQSAAIKFANTKIEQKKIKSPVNGIILEWKKNLGEGVAIQEVVAQISPSGKIIVVTEIDELFADKIQINQTAIIRKFGDSIAIASGKIFFVSDFLKKKSLFTEQSGEAEDRRVRLIKIELENPKNLLLNSRVETVINLKK